MKLHKDGSQPKENQIFVFGSNLAGRHGAGAAKAALNYGAVYGKGIGLVGMTYAIPTKNEFIITMSIEDIAYFIDEFNQFVSDNQDKEFFLTRVGCGLAGFKDHQIAPMFKFFENVDYPEEWMNLIGQ